MVLTPMDWITIGLVVIFGVLGLIRGFIREVVNIASHVVAIILAFRMHENATSFLLGVLPKQYHPYAKIAGFFIIYIAVLIVFFVLEKLIRNLLVMLRLKFADNLLGLVFGMAKGLLIATVIFILVTSFFPKTERNLRKGVSYPVLKKCSEIVIRLSPKDFRNKFLHRRLPWLENRL